MSDTTKDSEWGMSKEFKACFDTLQERQKLFWRHYWQSNCKSKTQAAIAAGYSVDNARQSGWNITKSEKGRKVMGFYQREVGITEESVLSDLHAINNATMEDFTFLLGKDFVAEMTAQGANLRQVKKMTVKRRVVGKGKDKYEVEDVSVELYDKLKAIEIQARIRKLYSETTTNINITYEQALTKLEEAAEDLKTDPAHVRGVLEGRDGRAI